MKVSKKALYVVGGLIFSTILITNILMTQTSGQSNHVVSLATAQNYVNNYKNNPSIPNIKGGMFDRNIFDSILSQPDCVGIRYYYAKKNDGSATLVIVGVNSSGKDMENGIIGEEVKPCPPICDTQGTLAN
jgi:hypothetical protein